MTETYYAGCYWPYRKLSPEERAQRAEQLFRGLAQLDPLLTRWFEKAWTRKAALKLEFEPSAPVLREMLARKKYRDMFSAWNGHEEGEGCSISANFLGLPCTSVFRGGLLRTHLRTADGFSAVLRQLALAWDPDWGVATSHDVPDSVNPRDDRIRIGWVTYVAHRLGPVPPLPNPVRTEPVGDLGTLIVLTPEPFTASNLTHVRLVKEVRERFLAAGLLQRPD